MAEGQGHEDTGSWGGEVTDDILDDGCEFSDFGGGHGADNGWFGAFGGGEEGAETGKDLDLAREHLPHPAAFEHGGALDACLEHCGEGVVQSVGIVEDKNQKRAISAGSRHRLDRGNR